MKEWTKIDLWPDGKAGVEARYKDTDVARFVYIGGSDHWRYWLHHITPGAKAREVRWARELYDAVIDPEIHVYVIGGHSDDR